ncbi:MAG: hypothetical protein NTV07_05530, partial [Candidatus Omnitrophica bacterium]|nr:hypothetical protein [Candidatus Omnitrophota bacterium]
YSWKEFDLRKGHRALVVGPGAGAEVWATLLKTKRRVSVLGLNPFEVASSRAVAGKDISAKVHDNIADSKGRCPFRGPYDRVEWNMPGLGSRRSWDGHELRWDGDEGGRIFLRFVRNLKKIINKRDGRVLIWNSGLPEDKEFIIREFAKNGFSLLRMEDVGFVSPMDGKTVIKQPYAVYCFKYTGKVPALMNVRVIEKSQLSSVLRPRAYADRADIFIKVRHNLTAASAAREISALVSASFTPLAVKSGNLNEILVVLLYNDSGGVQVVSVAPRIEKFDFLMISHNMLMEKAGVDPKQQHCVRVDMYFDIKTKMPTDITIIPRVVGGDTLKARRNEFNKTVVLFNSVFAEMGCSAQDLEKTRMLLSYNPELAPGTQSFAGVMRQIRPGQQPKEHRLISAHIKAIAQKLNCSEADIEVLSIPDLDYEVHEAMQQPELSRGGVNYIYLIKTQGIVVRLARGRPAEQYVRRVKWLQQKLETLGRSLTITPIMEAGTIECEGVIPYVVMPFVKGRTLDSFISQGFFRHRPVTSLQVVENIFRTTLEFHRRLIFDSDVAPENYMLDIVNGEGVLRIFDYADSACPADYMVRELGNDAFHFEANGIEILIRYFLEGSGNSLSPADRAEIADLALGLSVPLMSLDPDKITAYYNRIIFPALSRLIEKYKQLEPAAQYIGPKQTSTAVMGSVLRPRATEERKAANRNKAIKAIISEKIGNKGINILFVCLKGLIRSNAANVVTKNYVQQRELADNVRVDYGGILGLSSEAYDADDVGKLLRPDGTELIWADIIFVAERAHMDFLIRRFPRLEGKVFLFTEFYSPDDPDFGTDLLDASEAAYTIIEKLEQYLFPLLVNASAPAAGPKLRDKGADYRAIICGV